MLKAWSTLRMSNIKNMLKACSTLRMSNIFFETTVLAEKDDIFANLSSFNWGIRCNNLLIFYTKT